MSQYFTPLSFLLQDLEQVLEPILFLYKEKARADEPFGDFCARTGFDALREYSAAYVAPEQVSSLPQVRPLPLNFTNTLPSTSRTSAMQGCAVATS